ncbi:MAG: hypothetical protein Q4A65_07795, partial [Bacillota bacterium]|nr:hypothetical protein [Bacillota bacterium]
KRRLFIVVTAIVCVALAFALTGCSESEDSYMDEADMTVGYLTTDYADQLMADGANTILGSVSIDETDGVYTVTVTEKEVVHSSDYADGYYIAETNVVEQYGLGGYAKIIYADENGEDIIGNADGFIKNHNEDTEQLYTVYYMNDTVELIVPVAPEDVEVTY